jgi:hypothetical protein
MCCFEGAKLQNNTGAMKKAPDKNLMLFLQLFCKY